MESPNDKDIHFSLLWSWWSERLSSYNCGHHLLGPLLVDLCLMYYLIPMII